MSRNAENGDCPDRPLRFAQWRRDLTSNPATVWLRERHVLARGRQYARDGGTAIARERRARSRAREYSRDDG